MPIERNIQILAGSPPWRNVVAVRKATSMKAALLSYYRETLEPQGVKDANVVGNVMTVVKRNEDIVQYIAREAK